MTSAAPPTDFFPGINFNPSFYNLGSSAVTLDYLNSNFLRSTGYAISRAQYTLFNGSVNIQQNLDVSQNINAGAYFLNSVPVSFSQWTTSGNDIYYNTGNVGIGKTNPNSIYKLDVSGNINADKIFRAGTELTQYTDTNVRTVLSTSAGTNMTWNTSTLKFDVAAPYTDANTRTVLSNSAGTNMTWNTSTLKFDVAAPYTDANTRTVLSNSAGTNMTWNTSTLKFDVAAPYTLPTASTTTLGGVRIDGTSININSGVISLSGNDIILTGGTNNRSYGWTGATSLLGRVGTAGNYSTGSLVEDIVLRSQGRLVLQSGTTNPAIVIDTANNVGIGTTNPTSGYKLEVSGNIITTGNIALVNTSRSIFWTGTNSNLARAGVAGEYSTSSAINDIVLRSGNKLILQSGTGAAGIVIDTANNVGIGINTETKLDVDGNLLIRAYGTTGSGTKGLFFRTGFITTNQYNCSILTFDHGGGGPTDGISVNGFGGVSFCTGSNTRQERMRITDGGNVGIGINPTTKLHVSSGLTTAGMSFPVRIGGGAYANFGNNTGTFIGLNTEDATWSKCAIGHVRTAGYDVGDMVFLTRNSIDTATCDMTNERMRILSGGGVNINGDVFITSSRLVLRGNQPTLYLRDTDNRSGMIHMNSNIMYFLNGNGNDSETWATQNGQGWSLQINMNNNDATFGGAVACNNLSVGGNNITQVIKNQHLFSIYRTSLTLVQFQLQTYIEAVYDIETNLKFNEYYRPQLNVRWNISGSINNGNSADSNKYFFMNFFYNQLGGGIAYNVTHSNGVWSFSNWWNSVGNNYLRITVRLESNADFLNVNI